MPDPSKRRRRRPIPSRRDVADTARQAAERVLRAHRNDATAAIADLVDQTYRLREKLRTARESAPKDGAVVLSGDDVKRWEAIKALNLSPEEIGGLATKVKDLEKQVEERTFSEILANAADTAKFPKEILSDLVTARKLKVEVKNEKVKTKGEDGKDKLETRKVVYVTEQGEGKVPVELSAYVEEHAPRYSELFGVEEEDTTKKDKGDTTESRRPFKIGQSGGGSDKNEKSAVDQQIEANRKAATAPNPLRPAKTTT